MMAKLHSTFVVALPSSALQSGHPQPHVVVMHADHLPSTRGTALTAQPSFGAVLEAATGSPFQQLLTVSCCQLQSGCGPSQ